MRRVRCHGPCLRFWAFAWLVMVAGNALDSRRAWGADWGYEPREGVLRVMGCPDRSGGAESGGAAGERVGVSLEGRRYLAKLAALAPQSSSNQAAGRRSDDGRRLLADELRGVAPIAFVTRHPFVRPNSPGSMISQSEPTRWGCGIGVYDPARPNVPPRTVFADPHGSIFDMNLSLDGSTLFFSYRRQADRCWQIHAIGVDGRNLQRISRDPCHDDVSPIELHGGDLLFVSTRSGGFLLSEPGRRSNLWVMRRDGDGARCVSQNTLADFSPHLLADGQVAFTRWEYVDRDVEYRLGLWTQRPDGRGFQLFFGNTIREVGMLWQARPVPGHDGLLVATFAPPNGAPCGAIGLVTNRRGPEAPRQQGFAWITDESFPVGDPLQHAHGMSYRDVDDGRLLDLAIRDDTLRRGRDRAADPDDLALNHGPEFRARNWLDSSRWAYCDPYPVSDYLSLAAYGVASRFMEDGGWAAPSTTDTAPVEKTSDPPERFALYLLDLCGNRLQVYADPQRGCYNPLVVRPARAVVATAAPRGDPRPAPLPGGTAGAGRRPDAWGTLLVADIYRGLSGVRRGQARYVQIMEQLPKTHEYPRLAYDHSPVMGYGTFYAKRCWGRVPIESDGSAHFDVPAMREIYLQVLDAEGRELQRQTSSIQVLPGEVRGCVGCHEPRTTAPAAGAVPLAARRPPLRPQPPSWTRNGAIDFLTLVQPVLDRHCTRCHVGANPDGGCDLSADRTRLFNMAYDNLLGRSRSYRQHSLTMGEMLSQEAAQGWPLVHFYWLRRAPTASNRPLQSGSYVSRIGDYLDRSHCGREVPWEDRQRIYTWIDANVPFYADYVADRPRSPGGRDRCADPDTGRPAAWFAEFVGVIDRRCAPCHGTFPGPNDHDRIWEGRFAWINFTHPEWSPALCVHLSKESGGRGRGTRDFGAGPPLFSDTTDPDYAIMRNAIREGCRQIPAPRTGATR